MEYIKNSAEEKTHKRYKNISYKIIGLLSVLGITFLCLGTDFKKTPAAVELEDGDTFVFIGNSITHQCLYTQYVEDYYYTRYPDRRIYFHNAGVSGDVASDVNERMEEDILAFNPKYASVLIGMNDGQYTYFKDEIFNTYKQDMTILVNRLDEAGIRPVLVTPTMFDLVAVLMQGDDLWLENPEEIHYNATLAFFGAWLYQVATERGFGFVNMFEPLIRITRENRVIDTTFTLIGDAVHPGPDGQVVMALALLKDIGADPVVSSIHIDNMNDGWELLETVSGDIEPMDGDNIRFRFTANSLPWVLPEEASEGYNLSSAGSEMSREIIQVTGLRNGNYILKIDGNSVGEYTHLEFAGGIELQENKLTPQYKQALMVASINKRKNEEVISEMRDLWLVKKSLTWISEIEDENDEDVINTKKWLEEQFGTADMDEYMKIFNERIPVLKTGAQILEDEIYKINQPNSHIYEIIKQ